MIKIEIPIEIYDAYLIFEASEQYIIDTNDKMLNVLVGAMRSRFLELMDKPLPPYDNVTDMYVSVELEG